MNLFSKRLTADVKKIVHEINQISSIQGKKKGTISGDLQDQKWYKCTNHHLKGVSHNR